MDYNDGNRIVVDKITTTGNAAHKKIEAGCDKTQLFLYVLHLHHRVYGDVQYQRRHK